MAIPGLGIVDLVSAVTETFGPCEIQVLRLLVGHAWDRPRPSAACRSSSGRRPPRLCTRPAGRRSRSFRSPSEARSPPHSGTSGTWPPTRRTSGRPCRRNPKRNQNRRRGRRVARLIRGAATGQQAREAGEGRERDASTGEVKFIGHGWPPCAVRVSALSRSRIGGRFATYRVCVSPRGWYTNKKTPPIRVNKRPPIRDRRCMDTCAAQGVAHAKSSSFSSFPWCWPRWWRPRLRRSPCAAAVESVRPYTSHGLVTARRIPARGRPRLGDHADRAAIGWSPRATAPAHPTRLRSAPLGAGGCASAP